jgi:DNA-directed RNA polymerase subunit H (RpoH/RPB5)
LVKHEVLSDSAATAIAKKFRTPLNKFPKISQTDPQCIKIGATPGQLVEISREDNGVNYTYYRYVVK